MEDFDAEFGAFLRPHLPLLDTGVPVRADVELRSLGLDSLALIELLVSIEDTFEVEFPDELLTAQTFRTPATLWTAVATLRSAVGVEAGAGG